MSALCLVWGKWTIPRLEKNRRRMVCCKAAGPWCEHKRCMSIPDMMKNILIAIWSQKKHSFMQSVKGARVHVCIRRHFKSLLIPVGDLHWCGSSINHYLLTAWRVQSESEVCPGLRVALRQLGSLSLLSQWAWSEYGQTSLSRSLRRSLPRKSRPGICCGRRLRCTRHRWDWPGRKRCTTSLLYGNGHSCLKQIWLRSSWMRMFIESIPADGFF